MHDDPWDRAAEFEMADYDVVKEALFPDDHKTAAARYHDSAVSHDWLESPTKILEERAQLEKVARLQAAEPLVKKAEAAPAVAPGSP